MPEMTEEFIQGQLAAFRQFYEDGLLKEVDYRAKLEALGVDPDTVLAPPPADARACYLTYVINAHRQLNSRASARPAGLVSIDLEEIYVTLTATVRKTVRPRRPGSRRWPALAPGEAKRRAWRQRGRDGAAGQGAVQEALEDAPAPGGLGRSRLWQDHAAALSGPHLRPRFC